MGKVIGINQRISVTLIENGLKAVFDGVFSKEFARSLAEYEFQGENRLKKAVNNDQLCMFFDKMDFRTRDTEFDLIYVNGDNTLPNLRRDEEHWKVVLTEEEFQKRMFEEE